MKIRIFLILFAFNSIWSAAYAQGKIVLLNGNEKLFTTAEVKGEMIEYQPQGATKPSLKKIDKYDVFSIVRDSSGEEIIYAPDTVSDEDPTVDEVRDYILGEKYAAFSYNKPANFVTGLEVGVISGFTLPIFYGIGVPIIYSIGLSQFTPKIKGPLKHNYDQKSGVFSTLPTDSVVSNIHLTEAFSAGYGKRARNMKFKKSLIGGGIGFGLGAAAIAIIKAQ